MSIRIRSSSLVLLLPLLSSLKALAVSGHEGAGGGSDTMDVSFDELCRYDDCKHLKNKDGSFIQPKRNILAMLRALAPHIRDMGSKFGVDPRAIAGAILAENTLNVQIDDDIQNWLVKYRVAPTANLFGKSFTIGPGQIHTDVAMAAEPLVAKIEGGVLVGMRNRWRRRS